MPGIYDQADVAYDSPLSYDQGAAGNRNLGWLAVLNELAGKSGLGENAAANFYAYGKDKGNGILQALNDKAGTSGLGLDAACNAIAGTSGLSAVTALNLMAGDAAP